MREVFKTPRNQRRKFTEPEMKELLEDQLKRPPTGLPRAALRREIQMLNQYRWKQLMKQYKWVQKQMLKLGYNPEDARWLL